MQASSNKEDISNKKQPISREERMKQR